VTGTGSGAEKSDCPEWLLWPYLTEKTEIVAFTYTILFMKSEIEKSGGYHV
jgi:hypothetical protein